MKSTTNTQQSVSADKNGRTVRYIFNLRLNLHFGEKMDFPSTRKAICLLFVSILYLLMCSCAVPVHYPGLSGTLLDSNSKLPIKGAHVICIDKYYKFIQAINVGGPNSNHLAIHITATDSNGYFKLPSYFKWTFPSHGLREILIYKEGYYSPIYFQSGKYSFYFYHPDNNHLDIESDYFSNLSLTENIKDRKGFIYDFTTTAQSLLSRTIYCAQDLSWHNKSKFNQFRPVFKKIHSILSNDTVIIKEQLSKKKYHHTTTERVLKDWDSDLNGLRVLISRSDTVTPVNTIEQRMRNSSGVVRVKPEARH